MSPQFTPNRKDGRAVWRVLYDELVSRLTSEKLKLGDIVSHSDLRSLLTNSEHSSYYASVSRASMELGKSHSRMLQAHRGSGYRLIGGTAQVELGQAHRKRGVRNIKKGLKLVKMSDRSLMTAADRSWADKVEGGMVTLATISVMHEERLMEVDSAIKDLRSQQITSKLQLTATADEVAELRRRIDEMDALKKSA